MKHRVFIAINLPEGVKKKLASHKDKWPELPARWTKEDNLHITLEFLGYVSDEEILEILKTAEETASKHASFEVKLNKICYGPLGKMPPRMIWAIGDKINEFNAAPHITLARIKFLDDKIKFKDGLKIKLPGLEFNVDNFKLVRSKLSPYGHEYEDIGVYNLK